MKKIKVAVLTEIISPYRIPVLNFLATDPRINLQVLFFAETEQRRSWRIPKEKINFPYQVLKGFVVSRAYQEGPIFLNPGILGELLKSNYDCLIVFGYHHPTIWVAIAYARIARKRCLIWSESTLRDKRPQNRAKEMFKRFLVRQASGYIAPGKAQVEYLAELGASPDRIWVAPNSVDSGLFAQAAEQLRPQKEQLKQQLGIKGDVLLYVGRLLDDKGIPELLSAFDQIRQEWAPVNLVLVGDGPEREKYVNECCRRGLSEVMFAGFQEQEALPRYYAIADIFIFPTRSDPWGLVLNEAMLAGLPIICSRAAGAADDLVKPEKNGFLHEPGDVAGIANHICHLLQDNELRKQMGKRSRQIINAYTPKNMANGFREAILGLLENEKE
ncbi:MAG: glycosyltransferase family 4 protein [Xenococcaceae cyanobacterium]